VSALLRDATVLRRIPRSWIAGGVLLLLVPMAIVFTLTWSPLSGSLSNGVFLSTPVNQNELAERYGVKIDLVAVTAAGGLVDVRFSVLDKDKAEALFEGDGVLPIVAVEGTETVLRPSHGMHHDLTLLKGGRYFILYSNSGGHVQDGTLVSVVIDGVRIEHLVAQI